MAKDEKENKKVNWNKIAKVLGDKVQAKAKDEHVDLPVTLFKIIVDKDCNLNLQVPFEAMELYFSD